MQNNEKESISKPSTNNNTTTTNNVAINGHKENRITAIKNYFNSISVERKF